MTNIRQILTTYGLDDKETSLYLAALSLGDARMTRIAKEAGIKRSTAYLTFKSLEAKGLMGSFKMRGGMRFVATAPHLLSEQARKKAENIEALVPHLQALMHKDDDQPHITYYEGEAGYMAAIEDSLKKPGIMLRHIGNLTEVHKTMGEDYDLNRYVPRRLKQNISMHALYFDDITQKIVQRNHHKEKREIRYLPKKYYYNTSTLIYENKVIISSTRKELVTVMIESAPIAQGEIAKFDLIWDLIGPAKE